MQTLDLYPLPTELPLITKNKFLTVLAMSAMTLLLITPAFPSALAAVAATPGAPPNNGQTASTNLETPVPVTFYVDGVPDQGIFGFGAAPGSQFSLNVTATYPWTGFPSAESFTIQYSLAPFPLPGVAPPWLGLSVSPSSSTMAKGSSSSTSLRVIVSKTMGDGSIGSFALHALYVDPVSDQHVLHVMVMNITTVSSSNEMPQSTKVPAVTSDSSPIGGSGSWALGTGLCDSGSTGQCSGVGISWGSVVGIADWFTVPSGFTDSKTTAIVLTGSFASGWYFQFGLYAPTSTGGTSWQETAWVISPGNSYACSFNTDTASSGNPWEMQVVYNSFYGIWYFSDPNSSWQVQFYCSGYASSSSFYAQNQEPFAFESHDTNGGDFANLLLDANPVFQYTFNLATWYNPPGAYVLNANDGSSWGSYIVGGGSLTPAGVVEGGHLQCSSLGTYELELGYYTSVGCGTSSYRVRLMT